MDLYEMFEWTWHLSTFGGILWTIFMTFIMSWYGLVWMPILIIADEDNDKITIISFAVYVFAPILLIGVVGYIGYLING